MKYIKSLEEIYLKNQKEKILIFSTELYNSWDITKEQLQETYYHLFIKNKI